MLPRKLEPEWLDELPADDPRAMRSRRDLVRLNAWMGQAGIMARALLAHGEPTRPRRLLDLGAGDGSFMLRIARRLARRWPGVTAILLDRQDIVSRETREAFAALAWTVETVTADVFDFLGRARPGDLDAITGNLFLHHFTEAQLARLFAQAAPACRLFVACEPRRAKFAVRASRVLWAIGCNDVTVHDAVASARAGFDGRELSALWPGRGGWELHERAAGLFSHCFVARALPSR
ncbi:MAG TPA: methyltransferase domain-containing protein [Xanthobacteraceae bacterium]|nr:methyltransferase domain-containing protein [Xanthobacteraceae bacterium]